jgi:hypothetical protein
MSILEVAYPWEMDGRTMVFFWGDWKAGSREVGKSGSQEVGKTGRPGVLGEGGIGRLGASRINLFSTSIPPPII